MPEYFYTALDSRGRRHTDSIEAESADEALRQLRDEGCTDVVLHTDDVMASVLNVTPENRRFYSPRELVSLGRMRFPELLLFSVGKHVRNAWWCFLLAICFLAFRRWEEDPWHIMDWLLVAFLLSPLVLVPITLLMGPSRKYDRLLQAVVFAEWEDVLERVENLKQQLPVNEVLFRKAQAQIGLGEVEEGLRTFQVLEYTQDIPDWLYWSLRSELCFKADRIEDGLIAGEKAAKLAPDNATVLLDYADSLLLHKRDAAAAAQLLAWAKEKPISDLIVWAVSQVEGMLALESGAPRAAVEHLERARAEAQVIRANGLYPLIQAKLATYLCLACAALGDAAAALRHFGRARPLLELHKKRELLQRCHEALAAAGATAKRG
jgi:tetratricopeptide (TPR) repeat protein